MSSHLKNTAAIAAGTLAAGIGYASLIERNAFALRELTMPVLTPGSTPLRVLHLSDLHMLPRQRRKQAWLRELTALQPDFVVNTGDNLSHQKAVPAVVQALGDLLSVPGVFVFGSNDYFAPRPKNPTNYLFNKKRRIHGDPLPWQDLRAAFTERGWLDMTHTRREFDVAGLRIAAAGVDDPHLKRDRYDTIAGAPSPTANLSLGLTHSPEPWVLDRFAADGYQLVMAGHTHGGQLCLPFYGAVATNCELDRSRAKGPSQWGADMKLHVSAGIGTSPYAPVRFCCRPEATLLTLVASPTKGPQLGYPCRTSTSDRIGTVNTGGDIACSRPRDWVDNAVRLIEADARRSADTHLLRYPLPAAWADRFDVALYLKDETTHITGSLKHRLARSLFLYALCNGWIGEGTTVIEASSGSTAVSEAYFAALLGLPFIAVMPSTTSPSKIALIESQGGRCHFVTRSAEVYAEAERLAVQTGGHYLDQFTNAERATDWRGNNNIAESIFEQLGEEAHPVPDWIVVGAGTGGTSATIGRYLRYRRYPTRLCVVDPENSAFFPSYAQGDRHIETGASSRIEGIGRPRVEPSFLPGVVDRMITVPDAASVAAAHHVSRVLGRRVGPSTGTNVWGAFRLLAEMTAQQRSGSVVTLLADSGDRYTDTYFNAEWLASQGLNPSTPAEALVEFESSGLWA